MHMTAGKVYLLALLGVMTMSTLMVAGRALEGEVGSAIFFVFLISMVGTASWLMWFSFEFRRDADRLLGRAYRALGSWLVLSGSALFCLGVSRGDWLMMLLSLLGVAFGANMWRLVLRPERDGRWWVAHHTNGAMLNFIATHDSFMALGIGSVIPELREPLPRMLIAAGVIAIGVSLRVRFGRARAKRARYSARSATIGSTSAARRAER
jgi:hypothetical protein